MSVYGHIWTYMDVYVEPYKKTYTKHICMHICPNIYVTMYYIWQYMYPTYMFHICLFRMGCGRILYYRQLKDVAYSQRILSYATHA